eukprot:g37451.t1
MSSIKIERVGRTKTRPLDNIRVEWAGKSCPAAFDWLRPGVYPFGPCSDVKKARQMNHVEPEVEGVLIWKKGNMCEVTAANFQLLYPQIKEEIGNCDFV